MDSKDAFSRYQELRKRAESEAREQVRSWAFANAPKEMTLAELDDLAMISVRLINHHTRQVYDMMLTASNREK